MKFSLDAVYAVAAQHENNKPHQKTVLPELVEGHAGIGGFAHEATE